MQQRSKWALALCACTALFLVAIAFAFVSNGGEAETDVRRPVKVRSEQSPLDQKHMLRLVNQAEKQEPPLDPLDEVRAAIADHMRRVEEAPESEDAPALLLAAGNLHGYYLGDWHQMIWCYQQVLSRYPEYPGRNGIYIDLAMAYEEIGDEEASMQVALEMLKIFPDYTFEYEWANDKLGIKRLEGPEPGSLEEAELLRKQAEEMAIEQQKQEALEAALAAEEEEVQTDGETDDEAGTEAPEGAVENGETGT